MKYILLRTQSIFVLSSQAITLRDAHDVLHLERLETLGDSCLKYMVSFSLYMKNKGMDEGDLTIMKGELVSNKNLFNIGKKLEIGSYIKVRAHKPLPFNSAVVFQKYNRTRFDFHRRLIFCRKHYGVLLGFQYHRVF